MNFIEKLQIKVHCTKFREAQTLSPKSFSGLNRLREELPQFNSADDVSAFAAFCKSTGTRVIKTTKRAHELNPTQSHIDTDKVIGIVQSWTQSSPAVMDPIVIDKDGYIIDGHHRWSALMYINPNMEIPCYQINVKVKYLLSNKVPRWQDTLGDTSSELSEAKVKVDGKVYSGKITKRYKATNSGGFKKDIDVIDIKLDPESAKRRGLPNIKEVPLKNLLSEENGLDGDIIDSAQMFEGIRNGVINAVKKEAKLFSLKKAEGKLLAVLDRNGNDFILLRVVSKGVALQVYFPGSTTPEVKIFNHWNPEYNLRLLKNVLDVISGLKEYWEDPQLADSNRSEIDKIRKQYRTQMSKF